MNSLVAFVSVNKMIEKNYRRMQKYTKKLAIVCLLLALVFWFFFELLARLCLIAGLCAAVHSACLKIVVYYFDQHQDK